MIYARWGGFLAATVFVLAVRMSAQPEPGEAGDIRYARHVEQESRWELVHTMMVAAGSSARGARSANSVYLVWNELTLRFVRDFGWDFFQQYPEDERRWQWAEFVLDGDYNRTPHYYELDELWNRRNERGARMTPDRAAYEIWTKRQAALVSAALAPPGAPAALRCKIRCMQITDTLVRPFRLRQVTGEQMDWLGLARAVHAIGEEFPTADEERVQELAILAVDASAKYSPDRGKAVISLLKTSTNMLIRQVADAPAALETIQKEPLQMKFTAIDGREIDLEQLRGRIVLIEFWATWCGACKVQLPLLRQVYEKYHVRGFEVIAIACERKPDDLSTLRSFVEANQLAWPQYFDGKGMRNKFAVEYGFTGVPQYFLLGKDGRLVAHTESSGGLRNIEEVVRQLLQLDPLRKGDEQKILGGAVESVADIGARP